jgi:zinc metalloprotease ZmpA
MKRLSVLALSVIVLTVGLIIPSPSAQANNKIRPDLSLAQFTTAVEAARGRVEGLNKRNDLDTFEPLNAVADPFGRIHVRFSQEHQGLRVFGGQIITHQHADGSFEKDTIGGVVESELNVVPEVPVSMATEIAMTHLGTSKSSKSSELVIVSGGYFESGEPVLAWQLEFQTRDAVSPHLWGVFVDASAANRGVVLVDDAVKTASAQGTGKTQYTGNVAVHTDSITGGFRMVDTRSGRNGSLNTTNQQGGYNYTTDAQGRQDVFLPRAQGVLFTDADNIWGTNSNGSVQTDAADAHFGGATTYDFYNTVLGRDGIWGDGSGSVSRVNYGKKYNNAFWADDLAGMTYGRGDGRNFNPLTTLDICGHEMTHGLTHLTADLTYSGESGGLNEAMSDCMGASVEQWADATLCDAPGSNPFKYWEIGEQCYTPTRANDALRYMYDPAKDGASKNEWYSGIGSIDVHYSSGPLNLCFYLLSQGGRNPRTPRGNNQTEYPTVTGIGYQAAAVIWYNGLLYMTPSTNYAGARAAMLQAAGAPGSANYVAVANAFVNINVK